MTPPEPNPISASPSTSTSGMAQDILHRVVIVGGGFGGLNAALGLKSAMREKRCSVTLIDRTNHTLFQPLLYQVATAALDDTTIAVPLRSMLARTPGAYVLMATVRGIDRDRRRVLLEDGDPVPFDTLILATGAVYSWFGHDDWVERAPALKSAADAVALRDRLLLAFERAEREPDPAARRRLLTFVVIGAGPTGVELAGAISELAHTTLKRDFRHIDPQHARIVLCDAGPRVLASFPEQLSAYAAKRLQAMGIELHLGAGVTALDATGVQAGDRRIDADCIFWAAGTQATPVARWLGVDGNKRGLVPVNPDCSLPGDASIFVIGDASALNDEKGKPLPGLGSVAKQQGAHVARVISGRLAGRPASRPFRYKDWGQLAMIGGSSAVADFGWIRLTGRVAWFVWSAVHLMLLISTRNRLVTYIQWVAAWLTYARGARIITGEPGPRA
ncbi:NAD(P)/FAD-dependent oxidoreductase [Acetobacteraceae bacterium KSS8]|uniref:NAD(P)/FAD-dependent oxidoreductase n=1 Tax=Endosaccharibacter trunci TaxID=2812733 RepID=A0ABT1W3Y6_9PROT|nr:NAD(P)/FAD-dependent oxidoreductase [Acetobacteraceae bacterium KSS8]